MLHFKYFAYLAIVGAVLLDLYSANPDTSATARLALDALALLFGVAGLGGLALNPSGFSRRRQ